MKPRNTAPDIAAVARMLAVRPTWAALRPASELLPMNGKVLLHAGPPLASLGELCAPLLNSAVMAVLFERWASTADDAEALLRSETVRLLPAQDYGCVVPLADVLSPSMWVQFVTDSNGSGSYGYSPLNGGSEHVMRVGQRGTEILRHLRWLNDWLAPRLAAVLQPAVSLLELADRGLEGGDDCHGRTAVATQLLADRLLARLRDGDSSICRQFLRNAPGFFLNLWMAATRCMMTAARGVSESTAIIAAGGNGRRFGIQIASDPDHWITDIATPPLIAGSTADLRQMSLPAIGDSAVVDLFGLGAMTTSAASGGMRECARFADVYADALDIGPRLLAAVHPGLVLTRARVVVTAAAVVEARSAPIVSLGVLDKDGQQGRIGGGYYRPPIELFAAGCATAGGR